MGSRDIPAEDLPHGCIALLRSAVPVSKQCRSSVSLLRVTCSSPRELFNDACNDTALHRCLLRPQQATSNQSDQQCTEPTCTKQRRR